MLDLAKREARDGEGTAAAFARLVQDGDERVQALYGAAQAAELAERSRDRNAHFRAVDSGEFAKQHAERSGAKGDLMERMEKYAAATKREGETDEEAFARMMSTDPTMRDLYSQYRAL
jgi:hypothetical protein